MVLIQKNAANNCTSGECRLYSQRDSSSAEQLNRHMMVHPPATCPDRGVCSTKSSLNTIRDELKLKETNTATNSGSADFLPPRPSRQQTLVACNLDFGSSHLRI
jgi:hypothetical protein